MKCLECGFEASDGKSLSNHLRSTHDIDGQTYTITHMHGGSRPMCLKCGSETRYTAFQFKKHCHGCSREAMRAGGTIGGKSSAWNKGLKSNADPRVMAISARTSGERNPFYGHRHSDLTRIKISNSKRLTGETLESRIHARCSEFELITSLEDYTSRQQQHLKFRCLLCSCEQEKTLQSFERGSLCEFCFPISTSQWQLEIEEWIVGLGVNVKRADRTVISPKEVDILVPEKNFGIECHGLYFHSDAKEGNDKMSHAKKAEMAEKRSLNLLQIFFDEWRDRKEVVKGMIRSRLDIDIKRVGARKCHVVEVNAAQQRKFFEESHLSGYTPSRISWGLYWNDQIVACLSLRVPRQQKWNSWFEIARFAIKPGFRIPGGLSRLTKVAYEWVKDQEKTGIMTYVDRRVGAGNGYKSCGFTELGKTGVDYWYTDFDSRYDRFKFRARNGKTEKQIASESKVFKIWGAGSRILILQ